MSSGTARPTGDHGEVLAAGGLVLRELGATRQVLIVHRPHRHDWSFPKGHLDAGESFEQAALREVEEETGMRCALLNAVAPVHYLDSRGRPKEVRYWTMARLEGDFQVNEEVDVVRWVAVEEAPDLLTYDTDRELARQLIEPSAP